MQGCAPLAQQAAPPGERRIVALMPSFVEDLVTIGAARQIVGVSAGTTGVPAVRDVPRVADFASVDLERVVAVHPDVVVAIPAQVRLLEPLRRTTIRVVVLSDDSYASIFSNLARLGAISGHEATAAREIAYLRMRTAQLRAGEGHLRTTPSAFVVLGAQPIWTVGPSSYIGTLISLAGGRDAATRLRVAYGEYSAEALLEDQPDVIVSDPTTQLTSMLEREPWRSLHAVQEHHVFTIPDASVLERPGPRYVEGLAWLIKRFREVASSTAPSH